MANETQAEVEPEKGKSPTDLHKRFDKEVTGALKRQRKFLKQGNLIVDRFIDERNHGEEAYTNGYRGATHHRLNLFHTNISTMQAMLYGQTPKVDVSREHHDPGDDVARIAATLFQRILQADVDPSGENIPTVLKAALLDRLLPGIGVARVRYEFETEKQTSLNPATLMPEETEIVTNERVPIDYVHWQDFLWGWARTWAEVPWLGFRSYLDKDQVKERFGGKIAKGLEYKSQSPAGTDAAAESTEADQKNPLQKAEIWEIWCLDDKKVYWYSEGAPAILDAKDDPLKLNGFWPVPKPMVANCTTTLFRPRADYIMAQDIYNQIDNLYTRIAIITDAIKVVGVYDQGSGNSVGRMLKEGVENDLIPVDNWAMFAESGGLAGKIDWFPVDTVVGVLSTLRQVLGEQIDLLYQVTGMSDILRGANTDQYASDGTQQLKAKFGSVKIQALQEEFARFASDLEGLKAEVISKHFTEEQIIKQSGAQFLPQPDQDQLIPALQLMKAPDLKWRVDIRPESIAMVDYQQVQQERSGFLNTMATYIQSSQAMIKESPQMMPILMEMMKWAVAGFKGASTLEGLMDQAIDSETQRLMEEQQNPKEDEGQAQEQAKSQAQMQLEQMKGQNDLQKIQAKAQADLQTLQAKLQGEIQKIQVDAERDTALEDQRVQGQLSQIAADLQSTMQELQASLQADLSLEQAQATFDIASQDNDHQNTMVEIAAQNRLRSVGNESS